MDFKLGHMTVIVLLMCFFLSCAEGDREPFLFVQKGVKDIDVIEKSLGSTPLETRRQVVSDDFYPGASKHMLEFPIRYERRVDGFDPSEVVSYYFTQNDSLIRLIVYDWDKGEKTKTLIEIRDAMENESKRLDDYSNKFEDLFSQMNTLFGRPTSGNGEPNEEKGSQSKYISRKAKWVDDDLTVELSMIFTTESQGVGTHRIRMKVYWG